MKTRRVIISYDVYEPGDLSIFKERFANYLRNNPEVLKKEYFEIEEALRSEFFPQDELGLTWDGSLYYAEDSASDVIWEQQFDSTLYLFEGEDFRNFIDSLKGRTNTILSNE